MSSIPAHTLAQPPDFDQTGAYWVLDATGARMGTVRRYYPAGRREGAWLYLPLMNGAAVAEPQRSLADAARLVAVAADVIRSRHASGDHTLCAPAACLAARYAAEHRRLLSGEPHGVPADIVHRALRALDALHVHPDHGADGLRRALALWAHYADLSAAQVELVLAHFGDGLPLPADFSRCECGVTRWVGGFDLNATGRCNICAGGAS